MSRGPPDQLAISGLSDGLRHEKMVDNRAFPAHIYLASLAVFWRSRPVTSIRKRRVASHGLTPLSCTVSPLRTTLCQAAFLRRKGGCDEQSGSRDENREGRGHYQATGRKSLECARQWRTGGAEQRRQHHPGRIWHVLR